MEVEFFTVLVFCYKALAVITLVLVAGFATLGPFFAAGVTGNFLWLLLYIFSPLVLAICYKLFWLI